MWVGDTISWGHQLGTSAWYTITPSADHQAGSLSTGFSLCDRVARRRPAQPLPPGNMEYGPSAGVRLLPTRQHMYVQEIFHDRARTQLLSQLQPTFTVNDQSQALFNKCVGSHANCSMPLLETDTGLFSFRKGIEGKHTADSTISKIRKVQPQCECEGEGRWVVVAPGEVQVSWPSPGPSLHQ